MLTVFFFLCDYICILFFCPFQTFMKLPIDKDAAT